MSFLVLGHRGMGPTSLFPEVGTDVLPENSLAAFSHCLDLGADGIEFDVHLTKDGKLAVIHDDVLNKKVAGADRASTDLGLTSEYHLAGLALLDIGNGNKIPSLEQVLDLIVDRNEEYRARTGRNLTINIELKGEGTATPTYNVISKYIEEGLLSGDDFIFNSFHWDRLEEIKAHDPSLKVMPAIKTVALFGGENVTMPGFQVIEGAQYCSEGLGKLRDFIHKVGCHAVDCVIFDLRPELIRFCQEHNIGLFTSTSYESVNANEIVYPLSLMDRARKLLSFTGFRADNVTETRRTLDKITGSKATMGRSQNP